MQRTHRASILVLGVSMVLVVMTVWRIPLHAAYEDVSFWMSPSASRAYDYGSSHLDVKGDARMYDLQRAEYFLYKTIAIDPYFPYANHQLARIAFLRGQYDLALSRINTEIAHYGDIHHNSYYIRGLIEGYAGDYKSSIKDYERYVQSNPRNWAAINDLAWVLLKDKQYKKAASVTEEGLSLFPESPWLLNSHAIASFELKNYSTALDDLEKASALVEQVTDNQWSTAYPGNDPKVASEGVATLKNSIKDNLEKTRTKIEDNATAQK